MINLTLTDKRQDTETRKAVEAILNQFPTKYGQRYWLGVLVREGKVSKERMLFILWERDLIAQFK